MPQEIIILNIINRKKPMGFKQQLVLLHQIVLKFVHPVTYMGFGNLRNVYECIMVPVNRVREGDEKWLPQLLEASLEVP